MSNSIVLAILVTSFATYLSRFLGVVSSEKINESSKKNNYISRGGFIRNRLYYKAYYSNYFVVNFLWIQKKLSLSNFFFSYNTFNIK